MAGRARNGEKVHAAPHALALLNPCPVCGAETVLAVTEPHPTHINCEIHGYECHRCGPVNFLVVPRLPRQSAFSVSNAAGYSLGQRKAITSCRCLSVYWSWAAPN